MATTRAPISSAFSAQAANAPASSALALANGDVPWISDDPYLSGNFAPIGREIDAQELPVVAGRIPPELSGAYLRNGPNPLFEPIAFAFPMDGDGMIHAVFLAQGRARYRNRFVATRGLGVERRAGHAVYGSFTQPVPVDPGLLLPGDSPGPFKNGAFIHVIQHAGRLLALNEATTCYELNHDLETLGEWAAGTPVPIRIGAHNRRHPRTGELFSLAYSWRSRDVQLHRIDAGGLLVDTRMITLAEPTMIHDFVLTEHYLVIAAGPAVFDVDAARAGDSMLQWRPSLGMRIAIVPLDGTDVIWLQTDAFFVFHFANGFERGNQIVIDYVHHESLDLSAVSERPTTFRRLIIDLPRRSMRIDPLHGADVEFPRIDERREALPSRYAYMPTLTGTLAQPNPPSATFNAILKIDTETGAARCHDFGNRLTGEAVFVPRPGGGEDDGYLAMFTYDPTERSSDFVLLDAARIDTEPVAVVRLPQRVPQGLHGSWIPGA
ncbi:MAG: carotenoid oxygenase family protein [Pigmentiphaga sp.]